jgi:hypothetical protein
MNRIKLNNLKGRHLRWLTDVGAAPILARFARSLPHILALLLVAGCTKTAASGTVPDQFTPDMPTDHGMGTIAPSGMPTFAGHTALRMTVDQLRRSIPALFGGITWKVTRGGQQVVGFDALSRTLGEADYLAVTSDNRDASPIFEKFMDDMAGNVCDQAMAFDHTVSAGDQRLIIQSDTDIDQNLRFMRLKFHGLYVAPGSTEGISDLRGLYDQCAQDANGNADAGWGCVCVAVLTAPEFMAY